jgi:hypothetical protein
MVVGTKSDKELSRAKKAMGAAWVNDVNTLPYPCIDDFADALSIPF